MTRLSRTALVRFDFRWARVLGIAFLRRFFRAVWSHLLSCSSLGGRGRYRRLKAGLSSSVHLVVVGEEKPVTAAAAAVGRAVPCADVEADSDLVTLKISLLGDRHIGKTSFMVRNCSCSD